MLPLIGAPSSFVLIRPYSCLIGYTGMETSMFSVRKCAFILIYIIFSWIWSALRLVWTVDFSTVACLTWTTTCSGHWRKPVFMKVITANTKICTCDFFIVVFHQSTVCVRLKFAILKYYYRKWKQLTLAPGFSIHPLLVHARSRGNIRLRSNNPQVYITID